MFKYVSLGCSLTAQDGFVNSLNNKHSLGIHNLAVSAGSNQLQIFKLTNCLYNREIGEDTVLLWQITSPDRGHAILPIDNSQEYCKGIPYSESFNWVQEIIEPYGTNVAALLCNNSYHGSQIQIRQEILRNTFAEIYKYSKIVKHIIVYFGWNNMCENNILEEGINLIKGVKNIDILPYEHSIVNWCRNQSLQFADTSHPTRDSYIRWGDEILFPYINAGLV